LCESVNKRRVHCVVRRKGSQKERGARRERTKEKRERELKKAAKEEEKK